VKVIRKRLWEQEVTGDIVRWNIVEGYFETYDPASDTWHENPEADPRMNPMYRLPVRTTGDVVCDCAANMRAALEDMIDQFFIAVEVIQIANAILGIIAVFQPGFGLLAAIIIAAVELIIEIGIAQVLFDFTEEAWDEIQCLLYNNLEEDGTITPAGMSEVISQSGSIDPGSVIEPVLSILFGILGEVGLSNAGAAGDEIGDCSECGVWCYEYDFTVDNGGFTAAQGDYVTDEGWQTVLVYAGGDPARGRRQLIISRDLPVEATVKRIELYFTRTLGNTTAVSGSGIYTDAFSVTIKSIGISDASPSIYNGTLTIDNIGIALAVGGCDGCGDPGGVGVVQKIRFYGDGENPFGEDNCTD